MCGGLAVLCDCNSKAQYQIIKVMQLQNEISQVNAVFIERMGCLDI